MRNLASAVCLGFALLALPVAAQQAAPDGVRYVADIELQTSRELIELLRRANQLLIDGVAVQDGVPQVTLVLHGPVIRDLLRQNYPGSMELVNLAARLSALEVVRLEVCRTWMGANGVNERDLQPFVEAVDLARSEIQRLRTEENYVDF